MLKNHTIAKYQSNTGERLEEAKQPESLLLLPQLPKLLSHAISQKKKAQV